MILAKVRLFASRAIYNNHLDPSRVKVKTTALAHRRHNLRYSMGMCQKVHGTNQSTTLGLLPLLLRRHHIELPTIIPHHE